MGVIVFPDFSGLGSTVATNDVSGLKMIFLSGSSVSINPGRARSVDDEIDLVVPSFLALDKANPNGPLGLDTGAFTPNTWYAIYVIGSRNRLAPISAIFSTSFVAPALPPGYDTYRRVAVIRNGGAGAFLPVRQTGLARERKYIYEQVFVAQRVLVGGAAIVATPVSCAAFAPPTTTLAHLGLYQSGTAIAFYYRDPATLVRGMFPTSQSYEEFPLAADQTMAYSNFGGGGSVIIDVLGYEEEL